MNDFITSLEHGWHNKDTLVCVGLDPNFAKLPKHLLSEDTPVFEFCRQIIDATHDLVCAYKPQIAYFADQGLEVELQLIISYIKSNYPDVPVILDAKRGDIGSTATQYSVEAFDRYEADAVTINPYMGKDSAEPFLDRAEKGVIILCRTSNSGGSEFQDLDVDGMPLYQRVAKNIAESWNYNKNCCLVVGATWPQQMAQVRSIVDDMPFLVPGVGAQGGDVESLLKAGLTHNRDGLIINSSRGVIFANDGKDFAKAARVEIERLRSEINRYR